MYSLYKRAALRTASPIRSSSSLLRTSPSAVSRNMHHICAPQRHASEATQAKVAEVAGVRSVSTTAPLNAPLMASGMKRFRAAPAVPSRRHVYDDAATPTVLTFFEKATSTWQYIVYDPVSLEAAIVDSVLDYDPASGTVSTTTADGLLSFVEDNQLNITFILETHAHADHLTAAQYLKQQLGGNVQVGIGYRITQVQKTFAPIYGFDDPSIFDNTFDKYFKDDEEFQLGNLGCQVIHLPGHTPDHVGYVVGKAIFTGDSIFNPDVGSARADFPGGNVKDLFASTQRLLAYPPEYRLFVGHDYPTDREHLCSTTVGEQREMNKHVKAGTEEAAFIEWRGARDATLGAPRLLHPSLQVNIRAGKLPPTDEKGRSWFKTPIKSTLKL